MVFTGKNHAYILNMRVLYAGYICTDKERVSLLCGNVKKALS